MTKKQDFKQFTNVIVEELLTTPITLSSMICIDIIAREYSLQLLRKNDFEIAQRILINSIKNN